MTAIKKSLVAIALLALFIGMVAANGIIKYFYPNIGSINPKSSIEVYLEGQEYENNTAIDWGACAPGMTYSFSNFSVVNTGNTNLTVYIIPDGLPSDWTLAWEANNTLIQPKEMASGWLNLTIPETATEWPTWGFYLYAKP